MSRTRGERSPKWLIVFAMWIIATVATLGSLFFSEFMDFVPCTMCWYQRIFMYPMVFIFLIGILEVDKGVVKYSIPLSVIGFLIAVYHNLLHFGIVPESATPCSQGVSCATKYIEWFGFVTIPFLSMVAFGLIIILTFVLRRELKNEK